MHQKKILMATTNYWESPFQVGSHSIAKAFVALGWKVAFVSDPISPFHILQFKKSELFVRLKNYIRGGKWDDGEKLFSYIPCSLMTPNNKPILKSGWVLKNWFRLSFPNVISVISKNDFSEVDLLYIDSLSQSFWLDAIKFNKSVFRIADKSSGFKKFTSEMSLIEFEIAKRVDVVAYTAFNLEKYIDSLCPKEKYFFPNGVNYKHFSEETENTPAEFQNIKKPIVIYIGAMSYWFDFQLIASAASEMQDVSFVLIGNADLAKWKFEKNKNIFLLGIKNFSELPGYLQYSDVGIIPFDVEKYPDLVHNVNPLKLYEYMAAGIPVVATRWDELEKLNTPAILAGNKTEFISGIRNAIAENKSKKTVYRKYSQSLDWKSKVDDLVNLLFN